MLNTRAVSSFVQFAGGAEEKANPGREGTTTWKETGLPVDVSFFDIRGLMMGENSRKDPGQPWSNNNGIAFGSVDFSWIKWMSKPSIFAVKCLNLYFGQSVLRSLPSLVFS